MVMASVTSWVTVRRYDLLDESTADSSVPLSPPHPIELSTNLTLNELKMKIRKWLGLEQSEKEVIKLRLADQTLVPLTFLLEGTTQENPFLLDIARVHQNTPPCFRSLLPPSYVKSVQNRFLNLEKRIERIETLLPEMHDQQKEGLVETMKNIGTRIVFLDKRLDDLSPAEWKNNMLSHQV